MSIVYKSIQMCELSYIVRRIESYLVGTRVCPQTYKAFEQLRQSEPNATANSASGTKKKDFPFQIMK